METELLKQEKPVTQTTALQQAGEIVALQVPQMNVHHVEMEMSKALKNVTMETLLIMTVVQMRVPTLNVVTTLFNLVKIVMGLPTRLVQENVQMPVNAHRTSVVTVV